MIIGIKDRKGWYENHFLNIQSNEQWEKLMK